MGTQQDNKRHHHCGQGAHCQSIYRRLGQARGPSVTRGVLLAFGVPIAVFIVTLAAAAGVLGGSAAELNWQTVVALVIAATVTAAVVLLIWKITQQPVGHSGAMQE